MRNKIDALAFENGFDLFGVAPAVPPTPKGIDPKKLLPSARSILCLGISYYHPQTPLLCKEGQGEVDRKASTPPSPSPYKGEGIIGRIARYAWGMDYHKVVKKKLQQLKKQIMALAGPTTQLKEQVDCGPLPEKCTAAAAGLGFIGKNSLLIHPRHGSYFFLAEILTNLELDYDKPVEEGCGSCRACVDACPTQALRTPYALDVTRCIAYWTIEGRGEIPQELHQSIGNRVLGCDICQEACPFNGAGLPSGCEEFHPSQGPGPWLDLEKTGAMSEGAFHEAFAHTSLMRAKYSGIMRNTRVVLKNLCPQPSSKIL